MRRGGLLRPNHHGLVENTNGISCINIQETKHLIQPSSPKLGCIDLGLGAASPGVVADRKDRLFPADTPRSSRKTNVFF